MPQGTQLSKFSASGKTFFFNHQEARNGSPFLAINALYGRGNQERIILFEPHMLQFRRHLDEAVAEILGMDPRPETIPSTINVTQYKESNIPPACDKCGAGPGRWNLAIFGERCWQISCECGTIVYTTEKEDG